MPMPGKSPGISQPSTINHQPSAINHQPSAISHQPLAITHCQVTEMIPVGL